LSSIIGDTALRWRMPVANSKIPYRKTVCNYLRERQESTKDKLSSVSFESFVIPIDRDTHARPVSCGDMAMRRRSENRRIPANTPLGIRPAFRLVENVCEGRRLALFQKLKNNSIQLPPPDFFFQHFKLTADLSGGGRILLSAADQVRHSVGNRAIRHVF
jgi:hypothetical protein